MTNQASLQNLLLLASASEPKAVVVGILVGVLEIEVVLREVSPEHCAHKTPFQRMSLLNSSPRCILRPILHPLAADIGEVLKTNRIRRVHLAPHADIVHLPDIPPCLLKQSIGAELARATALRVESLRLAHVVYALWVCQGKKVQAEACFLLRCKNIWAS